MSRPPNKLADLFKMIEKGNAAVRKVVVPKTLADLERGTKRFGEDYGNQLVAQKREPMNVQKLFSPEGDESRKDFIRKFASIGSLVGGEGVNSGMGRIHPWEMSKTEFLSHKVPGGDFRDASRDISGIEAMRKDASSLADYVDDPQSIKEWLGGYSREPGWNVSHLAEHVRKGKPIKVYRATDAEGEIFPGAYVTPSKQYAMDHGERVLRGKYHLLESTVHPSELIAVNPNEFWYAPHDVGDFHRGSVAKAIASGKPVPPQVLQDYPDLLPK